MQKGEKIMAKRKVHYLKKEEKGLGSYAKIHNFLGEKTSDFPDLEKAFNRVAEHLKNTNERGHVQMEIGMKEGKQSWFLNLHEKGCEIKKGTTKAPNFEILVKSGTLTKIAEGKISPISAMAKGEMRVRGDLEFGKRFYKLLAADDGRIDPCKKEEK